MAEDSSLLTSVEKLIREQYSDSDLDKLRVPSTAIKPKQDERMQELLLPDSARSKMPFTKDKFIVKENPHLVAWERETRKFLRNLTPQHGHRVAAVMIYEWATGISVAKVMEEGGSAGPDLIKINKILRFYFDKPYATYIMGRKIPKAYRVPPGWYIRRHRPMTLTLYAEWCEGTLYP